MSSTLTTLLNTAFKKDVFEGLTSFPKFLYSKYIYDAIGDKLFQDIMALPEYYLTECEYEIFQLHRREIGHYFDQTHTGFDLIELGAGDGKKTKVLLREFVDQHMDFVYKPIDISEHAIDGLTSALSEEIPELQLAPEIGEYFEVLDRLHQYDARKKVIMVLGSNIGNLRHPRAIEFLTRLRQSMNSEDVLFMGFDQKKKPQTILDAYNDPTGVTEAFNKNLLHRINRDLGANFQVDEFSHWEVYDPETGTAKSFLVSQKQQTVDIEALQLKVSFDQWETIHTEISQKYDDKIVSWLAEESGLRIETSFTDSKQYYKNYLFRKKEA